MAADATTYYKNDGTGTYRSSSFLVFPTVESLGWSRDGYTFVSWNTRADGTGESYAEGSDNPNPIETGYCVYYAIWELDAPTYLDMAGLAKYDSLVKVIINGKVDTGGKAGGIPYGSVDSTSTSTNFTATVNGLTELYDGACVMLHNGVVTSAKGFTVNVNGLGAKKCYSNMTNATQETTVFNANYTLMFVYSTALDSGNGGWWIYRGYDANTTYTPAKLGFGYGHCTTAAATAAKAVAISSYTLVTGGIVSVRFDHDVQAGATLNVNSRGAKAIYHKGAAITDGVIKAGDTATFIYSGQYHLISIDHEAYTLPTATVTQLADGATITVTDEQGTTTATVHDGADGFSPTVSVSPITGGHEVTITDATGAHTFNVMDGEGGGGTDATTEAHVAQLWGNQLTKELTGEVLTASDAYAAPPMSVTVEGKSTQVTTTGKNLFDKDRTPRGYYNTSTGAFVENGWYVWWNVPVTEGDVVRWAYSWDCKPTYWNGGELVGHGNTANSSSYTVPAGVDEIRGYCNGDGWSTCIVTKNNADLVYEPYTSGEPSPTPEYPQAITSVEARVLKFAGKNLARLSDTTETKTTNGLTFTKDGQNLKVSGTATSSNIDSIILTVQSEPLLKAGNTYTISLQGTYNGITGSSLYFYTRRLNNTETTRNYITLRNQQIKFEPSYDCTLTELKLRVGQTSGPVNIDVYPQVEVGSTATAYEPYQATTVQVLPEGTTFRSLPDDTKDTLAMTYMRPSTREGFAWYSRELTVLVGETTTAVTDGITGTVGVDVMSTTGEIADGPTVLYKLVTPVTTTLDPIELPILPAPNCTVWSDPLTGLRMRYVRDTSIVIANLEAAYADLATS